MRNRSSRSTNCRTGFLEELPGCDVREATLDEARARLQPAGRAPMTSFVRITAMGFFLFGCLTLLAGIRALVDPDPGVPTPNLMAITNRLRDSPSSVTSQEVEVARAEWETVKQTRQRRLLLMLGLEVVVLIALGRQINRRHEDS